MSKRMVALLLALVMLLGLLPAGALAAEPENNSLGTVRVIVENMTAKKGQDLGTVGTCPWAGKLVDTDVEMEAGDNGITLVAKAGQMRVMPCWMAKTNLLIRTQPISHRSTALPAVTARKERITAGCAR